MDKVCFEWDCGGQQPRWQGDKSTRVYALGFASEWRLIVQWRGVSHRVAGRVN